MMPRPAFGGLAAGGALVLAAACWGFATVLSKQALDSLPPFALLALQVSASTGFLWMAAAVTRTPVRLSGNSWKALASGLLEPGLAYAVALPGLALTSAGSASVIGAAEPAFICALVWALTGRRPRTGVLLALGATSMGVVLVTTSGPAGVAVGSPNPLLGNALVLLGTGCAAVYVVASHRLVSHMAPLPLVVLQQSAGLVFALGLWAAAVASGVEARPPPLTAALLAVAALSGILQYALAFWLYLYGLRRVPAETAGVFLALAPLFGLSGAALVLGEMPGPLQLAGALLVVLAVAALSRSANEA